MQEFKTSTSRWQALITREPTADGAFVYCVRTTGIYCRPICKARLARRANVEFYATSLEAEGAGYRSCKRCRPELPMHSPESDKIDAVCQYLQNLNLEQPLPTLEDMAMLAGLTKFHFHRSFKRVVGLTPKAYLSIIAEQRNIASTVSPSNPIDQNSTDCCKPIMASDLVLDSMDRTLWESSHSTPSSRPAENLSRTSQMCPRP
ncbi:unnamed protein product [Aureobasidium uvarum]|uniref:HTH araC/xylS-type domain-containing protein n=1 Tax=Aureobasidium uvarum TaxID=2773716 RepID=A0A9N8PW99_9PEZI|nr:unnamed protein product [Aureobasidium uvarum]